MPLILLHCRRIIRVLDCSGFDGGSGMGPIADLKDAIRILHGVESTHKTSVPVKEVFNGRTVWEGIVELFTLHGHPKANTAYAWSHDADDPDNLRRHVTVLHIPPAVSPITAVRFAIVQELRQELRANAYIEAEASEDRKPTIAQKGG
jgi:hypothetical protein